MARGLPCVEPIMLSRPHLSLILAATVVPLLQACGGSATQAAQAPPPAPTVSIVTVGPETVPVSSEWVATLDGMVNAQIRPQVTGYLIKTHYREGAVVRKGQVLFEIDRASVRSRRRAGQRAARAGAGPARTHRTRRRSATRRSRKSARFRRVSSTTTSRRNLAAQAAVKSAEANRRHREAERRLHQGALADRRRRRDRHRADRRSRRPDRRCSRPCRRSIRSAPTSR